MTTIKEHVKAMRGLIIAEITASFVASTAMSFIPLYNKLLVDEVLPQKGRHFLGLALLYLFTYLLYLLMTRIESRFSWKSGIRFENTLKKTCFDKMLHIPYTIFREKKPGEYLSLITNNITQLEQDYLTPMVALIKSLFSVLVYAVIIAYATSPLICAVLLALSVLAAFSPKIYKKRLSAAGKAYVDEAAVYTKKVSDYLEGFDLLDRKTRKSFYRANAKITDSLSGTRWKMGRLKVDGLLVSGGAILMINVFVFLICGFLMLSGNITAGTVVAALTYAPAFADPLQEVLYDINTMHSTRGILDALNGFLAFDPPEPEKALPRESIVCSDLTVDFGRKKLRYNLELKMGEKYILCGLSGSGKTTLLNAVAGYVKYDGSLLLDGREKELDADAYCFISQQQHVFSDDFASNVTLYGAYPVEENRLCKLFGNDALFQRVRQSKDCSLLSGGEQQAVKLCRMLAQEKPLVFLDEPFSALDRENEAALIANLNLLPSTVVMITHNPDIEGLENWVRINIQEVCHEESA